MEKVNITIGSVAFDYADYDVDNDILRLSVGEPRGGECEETPELHVIRYAHGTSDILGLTIFNPRRLLERDGHLTVTIPRQSRMSADDLAPAFAAV